MVIVHILNGLGKKGIANNGKLVNSIKFIRFLLPMPPERDSSGGFEFILVSKKLVDRNQLNAKIWKIF